jgi:pyruvate formate lyase activating enzyme
MLKIHSLESFGTHEGPGIRFVVFLQGCNFACAYCHNPDTQDLSGGKEMAEAELLKQIEGNIPYFGKTGGVTFSGGEPLLQAGALAAFCKKLKEKNLNVALDTNGSILTAKAKELLSLTDLVLLDIKHIDPAWHQKITGTDNTTPLAFARYLEEIGKPFWLRYVLVPGYTDQPEYLRQLGKHFKDYKMVQRLEILPYHTFGVHKFQELEKKYQLENVKVPTNNEVTAAQKILKKYFSAVFIR